MGGNEINIKSFRQQGQFTGTGITQETCGLIKGDIDGDGDKDSVGVCIRSRSNVDSVTVATTNMPHSLGSAKDKFKIWRRSNRLLTVPGTGVFVNSKMTTPQHGRVSFTSAKLGKYHVDDSQTMKWRYSVPSGYIYSAISAFDDAITHTLKTGSVGARKKLRKRLLTYVKKPTMGSALSLISALNKINVKRNKVIRKASALENRANLEGDLKKAKPLFKEAERLLKTVGAGTSELIGTLDSKQLKFFARFAAKHGQRLRGYIKGNMGEEKMKELFADVLSDSKKLTMLKSLLTGIPEDDNNEGWGDYIGRALYELIEAEMSPDLLFAAYRALNPDHEDYIGAATVMYGRPELFFPADRNSDGVFYVAARLLKPAEMLNQTTVKLTGEGVRPRTTELHVGDLVDGFTIFRTDREISGAEVLQISESEGKTFIKIKEHDEDSGRWVEIVAAGTKPDADDEGDFGEYKDIRDRHVEGMVITGASLKEEVTPEE
jgi:hypothetical protein